MYYYHMAIMDIDNLTITQIGVLMRNMEKIQKSSGGKNR